MTVSIIIVTLNRPDCMRECLACLAKQSRRAEQIIVVDASADDLTKRIVAEHPGALYLRSEKGYGRMTASRNIGLMRASGEIISFIDDDAFPHPNWLENLVATYSDPAIGAVGGRALNNMAGEETRGVDEIGQLKPNGLLTGNFGADPGKIIEVDHIVGCNMSFRREVLATLGGLREGYTGTEVREETDICLRVRQLGFKIVFNPAACVDHIGAPQVKGKRFDARYDYYAQRNHLVLLIRNFGPKSPWLWRLLAQSLILSGGFEFVKRIAAAIARLGVTLGGTVTGLSSGLSLAAKNQRDPTRRDPEGQKIREILQVATSPLSNLPAEQSASGSQASKP